MGRSVHRLGKRRNDYSGRSGALSESEAVVLLGRVDEPGIGTFRTKTFCFSAKVRLDRESICLGTVPSRPWSKGMGGGTGGAGSEEAREGRDASEATRVEESLSSGIGTTWPIFSPD
jgi:hypothetical protein